MKLINETSMKTPQNCIQRFCTLSMVALMMQLGIVEAKSQYSTEDSSLGNIQLQRAYSYNYVSALDSEGNITFTTFQTTGLICFQTYDGVEYIAITDDKDRANVYLVLESEVKHIDKLKVHMFLGEQKGQEQTGIIQLFEVYDLDRSSIVPASFNLHFMNGQTAENIGNMTGGIIYGEITMFK